MRVAIVGLGLVGGSLARDLAARGDTVLGFDREQASLDAAVRAGVVTEPLDATLRGASTVDAFVLAVPVTAAPRLLLFARPHLKRVGLITDVGSTKRSIVRAAERMGLGKQFVGAHPLTGDHRSGWGASRRGLFEGAPAMLCPTRVTPEAVTASATELWRSLGASPSVVDAGEHDARMAMISHVPQMASSMLASMLAGAGIQRGELGPGGRDVTRLAGSDPSLWTAIAIDNATELTRALAECEKKMTALRRAIRRREVAKVKEFFSEGNEWFEKKP